MKSDETKKHAKIFIKESKVFVKVKFLAKINIGQQARLFGRSMFCFYTPRKRPKTTDILCI